MESSDGHICRIGQKSLRIAPGIANTINSRGFVYLKLGRLDAALADYDAALKLEPKLVQSLYGRGMAKLKKGNATGAAADIATAKAIKPDIAEEFAGYGMPVR